MLEFWTGGWLNTSIALFLLWLTHLPLPNQHEGLGGRRLLPGGRGGRNGGVAAERVDEGLRHAPPAAAAVCGGVRDAGHEEAEAQGAEAEGGGDGVGVRVAGGGGGGKGRLRGDSLGEELGLFFFIIIYFVFTGEYKEMNHPFPSLPFPSFSPFQSSPRQLLPHLDGRPHGRALLGVDVRRRHLHPARALGEGACMRAWGGVDESSERLGSSHVQALKQQQ